MKAGGEQLSVFGIDHAFAQALRDPLDHTTVNLAEQQNRVHGHAEVVDDGVADNLDLAGFRIDLDFTDMGAVGIGRLVLNDIGNPGAVVIGLGGLGHVGVADHPVGADNAGRAIDQFDIGCSGLEFIGGQFLHLFGQNLRGGGHRDATQRDRTRAAGAATVGKFRGIALTHGDPVEIDADLVGDKLAVGGGMALPVGLGAYVERDAAICVERQLGRLGAGKGAGLDVDRGAETAQPAAGLSLFRPARGSSPCPAFSSARVM
jgi:hypothetical protein